MELAELPAPSVEAPDRPGRLEVPGRTWCGRLRVGYHPLVPRSRRHRRRLRPRPSGAGERHRAESIEPCWRRTMTRNEQITQTVLSWPGVTAEPHRFGGVEVRLGKREI